jgi:hypothetical protein
MGLLQRPLQFIPSSDYSPPRRLSRTAPIGTIASGKQRTGASHPSADNPLDLDNTTLEVATILSSMPFQLPAQTDIG